MQTEPLDRPNRTCEACHAPATLLVRDAGDVVEACASCVAYSAEHYSA